MSQKQNNQQNGTVDTGESCGPVEKQPTKYTGRGGGGGGVFLSQQTQSSGKPRVVKLTDN